MSAKEIFSALESVADRRKLCDELGMTGKGGRYWCPDCQTSDHHTTPDFSVEAGFKCHRCGWKGDAVKLVELVRKMDFRPAREWLNNYLGIRPTQETTRKQGAKRVYPSASDALKASAGYTTRKTQQAHRVVSMWIYDDEDGRPYAAIGRIESTSGKTYRPAHKVLNGWITGDPPGAWPLYRLPAITASSGRVYVVEGEKATDAAVKIGLVCTTSAHGAKSPDKTDWTPLAGREVAILPDNDEAGQGYAATVARILMSLNPPAKVRVVMLPGLPEKGDVYDFVNDLRHEQTPEAIRAEVEALTDAAEVICTPPPAPASESDQRAALNAESEYGAPYYVNKDGVINDLNERYFADLYAQQNRILYEPDEREFYQYDGGRGLWHRVTPHAIETGIASMLRHWNREVINLKSFEKQINQTTLKAIVDAMRGMNERRGAFTDKPSIIHVANGVLTFDEQGRVSFGGFSPEHYSRNQSPIAYDPEAKCGRFVSELLESAMPADDVVLFQKWLGLALYGYNLPQRFLILDGTPGGGKGTLVRVVYGLIGAENCYQLRTDQLNERFELFRYIGKTLLQGPDVAGDFLMQKGASMLKALVGGDPLSPEGKNSNGSFGMSGTYNVVMTCNSRLTVRLDGDVDAWRRRMLIIRYENKPPERRIPDFDKVLLREEGAGILRWALDGFSMLKADLAECGDFILEDAQRTRVDNLLNESQSLQRFLEDQCERREGDTTNEELEYAYAVYCSEKGWSPLPMTLFHNKLPDLMLRLFQSARSQSIKREGSKGKRGYRRVCLKGTIQCDEPTRDDPREAMLEGIL